MNIKKVATSIMKEGFYGYVRRLIYGGVYNKSVYKLINHRLLNNDFAYVFKNKISLSGRGEGLTEELKLYGVHEPLATEIYRKMLQEILPTGKAGVIFDIGSNIGYYAMIASIEGGFLVHCFEPDPEVFEVLTKNDQALRFNWVLNPVALSSHSGSTRFYRSNVANWGGIRKDLVCNIIDEITVNSTTIDEYCERIGKYPSMIRMDIEGAELDVLKGALVCLSKQPYIFMEFHNSFLSEKEKHDMKLMLNEYGYKKAHVVKRYYDTPWSIKVKKYMVNENLPIEYVFNMNQYDDGVLGVFLLPPTRNPVKCNDSDII